MTTKLTTVAPPPAPPAPPAAPADDVIAEVDRLSSSVDPADQLKARLLVLQSPRAYASAALAKRRTR